MQTRFTRDALGQLQEKNACLLNGADDGQREQVKYRYDELGRLIEAANAQQYLAFDYDALGNITAETQVSLKNKHKHKQKIQHQYNILGQRLQTILPDGQVIDYSYDDSLGFNAVSFNGDTITNIQRDSLGREIQRRQGQLESRSDYDPQGRLSKQYTRHQENKQAIIQREYGYDIHGNLDFIKDGGEETRYIYDTLNRLKHTDGIQQEFFNFDPAGNILSITETQQSAPGLVKGNRLLVQGDKKFLYDDRGNLIKLARGKDARLVTVYHYNLQNELIKVDSHDANHTVTYAYDPLGRRISKTDTFGTTTFLWTDNSLAQEQRNNIKKTYLFEPGSFRPLAQIQDDQVYHYHLDHLGTPKELSNDAGRIVWRARYKTYGNLAVKEVDEIDNHLRFQGQYFDEETGLHYNRFRYYSPDTGQFINQDPIGLLGGLNSYQYVPSPTGWVDPLGLTTVRVARKLGNKDAAPMTPYGSPLRHDYLVVDGQVYSFQAGTNTGGMIWSQGFIDDNEYLDNPLSVIVSEDPEFDKATLQAIDEIGAPKYNVAAYPFTPMHIAGARNCQTWVDDVLKRAEAIMEENSRKEGC